jgi:succinate-semialdehyde dehydrogenase / glutarate-semialdehyde dehydrogenase
MQIFRAGQVCTAPNRIFVEDAVLDQFLAMYWKEIDSIKIGPGSQSGVDMGPLATRRRLEAMSRYTEDAREKGATILTTRASLPARGYFFHNSIVIEPPPSSLLASEEVFGPISSIFRFSTPEDAVRKANDVNVGLAGYVFTANSDLAQRVSRRLRVGAVGINQCRVMFVEAAFGGMLDSGYGRICGEQGLQAYLQGKLLASAKAPSQPT